MTSVAWGCVVTRAPFARFKRLESLQEPRFAGAQAISTVPALCVAASLGYRSCHTHRILPKGVSR